MAKADLQAQLGELLTRLEAAVTAGEAQLDDEARAKLSAVLASGTVADLDAAIADVDNLLNPGDDNDDTDDQGDTLTTGADSRLMRVRFHDGEPRRITIPTGDSYVDEGGVVCARTLELEFGEGGEAEVPPEIAIKLLAAFGHGRIALG